MASPQRVATDELERQVIHNVADFGWHVVNIMEDDGHPPWSFTIGFYETWQHPELIIIGRSRATAYHILNSVADDLETHRPIDLTAGTTTLIPKVTCHFVEVAARYYLDYVGFARWYYCAKNFPLYQIVWPSNEGHYPWDPAAADSYKEWQPLLGKGPTKKNH